MTEREEALLRAESALTVVSRALEGEKRDNDGLQEIIRCSEGEGLVMEERGRAKMEAVRVFVKSLKDAVVGGYEVIIDNI